MAMFSFVPRIPAGPSLFFGRTWKSALDMDLVSDDELLDEEEEEEDERKRERQRTPGPEGMGEHELRYMYITFALLYALINMP